MVVFVVVVVVLGTALTLEEAVHHKVDKKSQSVKNVKQLTFTSKVQCMAEECVLFKSALLTISHS